MCGIIGYSGPLDASKILLDGLSGLEYRGYDSAGIGLCMEDTSICIAKKVGKVKKFREYCAANIHGTAHSGHWPYPMGYPAGRRYRCQCSSASVPEKLP